jgi:flagellar hook-associated protein 1 FlgK
MSGLFGLLQTTKLTIFAQEMSLGILNHNIANANTPGYHRQRVNVSARGSLVGLGGNFGGGVNIDGVERFGDRFLTNQLGRVGADRAEQSALADSYGVLETIFGEPVDDTTGEQGLGDALDTFLNAWQPVVNPEMNADDADTRGLILEAAATLTHRFRDVAENVLDQAASLRERVSEGVTKVNSLLDEVAALNLALSSGSLNDSARADFEDTRDLKLRDLSALVGAEWQFTEQGQLKVYCGGRVLVDHVTVHGLEAKTVNEGRVPSLRLAPMDDNHPLVPAGGELKGLLTMLDEEVPALVERLDTLAGRFIEKVNAIHQAASGDGGGGVDFFTGSDASTIAVNPALVAHPEQVSLSGLLPDGQDIASAIFALHTETVDPVRGLTLQGLYAGLIGHLGARSASASQLTQAAEHLEAGLADRLESTAGVNIDEELAEMMIVQTTYQAAAKVIGAVDEMLNVLMGIL